MTHSDSEFYWREELALWFDSRAIHIQYTQLPPKIQQDVQRAFAMSQKVIIVNTPKRTAICIPK